MVPDSKPGLGLLCHKAGEMELKPPNVLNESVDNIQVNPEPSVPKAGVGRSIIRCLGKGRQMTFVLCRACCEFACLPGALLTGESSSSAGFSSSSASFQAGASQIPITSAPQLSTEAQVPAGFRAQPLLPLTNLCLAQPGPVLLSLGSIKS